jgi:ABC-type nitrate/sulfonate/bicarbonate transport system substrate-binding protein
MKKIFLVVSLLFSTLYGEKLQKATLQLSLLNQFQFAGYIVAKEKGYYKELGIDAEIREYSEESKKKS